MFDIKIIERNGEKFTAMRLRFIIKVLSMFSGLDIFALRAVKAFNRDGKIMGQEILEKECTSGDNQYVAPAAPRPLVEKSTVLKVRKLFRTPQKFK